MPTKAKAKANQQSTEVPGKNNDSVAADDDTEEQPTTVSNPCRCSFAVTGEVKTYQAIFICRTCCDDQQELFCVCEACANHCHEYHDEVDYLGMGMAYCDCSKLLPVVEGDGGGGGGGGCKLQTASELDAALLKIPVGSIAATKSAAPPLSIQQPSDEYVMDAYSILDLQQNATLCHGLIRQASELIQHSRETFWLDATQQDPSKWTDLEHMAWHIFQQHTNHYGIQVGDLAGAEWWVQVKKTKPVDDAEEQAYITELNTEAGDNSSTSRTRIKPGAEAIDLHYDKDETLAEKFGIGSFPTLSTVTYLTSASNPTIILNHTYEQEDDEVISEMLVSHPQHGKHLVFDGRLLHGAPSHPELRSTYQNNNKNNNTAYDSDNDANQKERVTLLVNIWANRKPAGVHPLSREIQKAIQKATKKVHASLSSSSFVPRTIETMDLEDDLEGETTTTLDDDAARNETGTTTTKERIELPFVGKGTTWESEDDDDESENGLVIVTCPPPKHDNDTIKIRFGPGLQAYLDHPCHEIMEDPNIAIANGGFQYEDAYI